VHDTDKIPDLGDNRPPAMAEAFDVAVIGAGAAGLATAIFAARAGAGRIVALDGARKLGAKILISGGGRCNITNKTVTERDFWGGNRNITKQVLRAFTVEATVSFFRELGVAVHEEEDGKLFPDSNRAHTVLNALLDEAQRRGVVLAPGSRVTALAGANGSGFRIATAAGGGVEARRVVLATGGMSVPETGSDGAGYGLARELGHKIVPTTPALAPLLLEGSGHTALRGVAHRVELDIQAEREGRTRLAGSLLWTHFGISGPVVLNASRLWHRAALERRTVRVTANLAGGRSFESLEEQLLDRASEQGRVAVRSIVSELMPAAVGDAVLAGAGIDGGVLLKDFTREARRRLLHAIAHRPLAIRDSRGFRFAEATAGGVELSEIQPSTLESRKCPGLYAVGEVLDVDGRIGGFNFQWAWASGNVAGQALARKD
jgi:predicted Rossmann fold flavoprotein